MSFESPQTEEQDPLAKEKIVEDEKSLWERAKASKLAVGALAGFMALSNIGCASGPGAEKAREVYENTRTARTLRVYSDTYTVGIKNSGAYKIEEHFEKTYRGPDESQHRDGHERDRSDQHERREHRESHRDDHKHSR